MNWVTLPSGRRVYDTGRVAIGLLYQPAPPQPGSQSEIVQRAICTPIPREWHECPRVIETRPPLWRRLLRSFAT